MPKMLRMTTSGEVSMVEVSGWQEMSAAIGSQLIERVRVTEDMAMAVDEEGLLTGREVNVTASVLYGTPKHGAPIVGDVLLGVEGYVPDEDGGGVDWIDPPDMGQFMADVSALIAERSA